MATSAGDDRNDISATPAAPGTSSRGWPGKSERDGSGEAAPLRPGPLPRLPRAPQAATPASRQHLTAVSPPPGAGGGAAWADQVADAGASRSLSAEPPPQRSPQGWEPPPWALPSRGLASRRRELCSPVNANPSRPGRPLAPRSLQCRPRSPPHAHRPPTEQPGQRLLQLQRVDAPDDRRAGLVWCFLSFPCPTILCDFKMTMTSCISQVFILRDSCLSSAVTGLWLLKKAYRGEVISRGCFITR